MNAPTRTGRARLLFAAILTGAVVAGGMAPALATSSEAVDRLKEATELVPSSAEVTLVEVTDLVGARSGIADPPGARG